MKRFIAAVSVFAMFFNVVPLQALAAVNGTVGNVLAFRLTANDYSLTANQPNGTGSFSGGSLQDYPEGSCIPFVFPIRNATASVDDVMAFPVYDYFNGVVGVERLELLSASAAIPTNLNQFSFSDIAYDLADNTPLTTTVGSPVTLQVDGPYAGNNTSTTAAGPTNLFRHYNVTVQAVPAGEIVNLLFCAQLSSEAGGFSGASMGVRNGGPGGAQNTGINPNQLLQLPEVNVIKVVDGGTAVESDFIMNVYASNPSLANFHASATGTVVTFDPGAYSIEESFAPDYTPSYSPDCVGTLAYDAPPVTCTVTNTYSPEETSGTLFIDKILVNAPDGVQQSDFSFEMYLNGILQDTYSFLNSPNVSSAENWGAGTTFEIVENPVPADYVVTYDGCTGVIAADSDSFCTVTNTYIQEGTITVVKELPNDDGGTEAVSDFELFLNGDVVQSGESNVLPPGDYALSEDWANNHYNFFPETNSVDEWYDVSYSCVDGNTVTTSPVVTLEDGHNIVCTITNDDKPASLTVVKLVGGIDGVLSSNFDMAISDANDVVVAEFAGSPTGVVTSLDSGSYIVGEVVDPDYVPYFTGDCDTDGSITLVPGQIATCTVSNEYSPLPPATGRVTVVKTIVGSDAQDSSFAYTLTQNNDTGSEISFVDDVATEYVLDEGTVFSIDEVMPLPDGYTVTDNGNCSGVVVADTTIDCVITNTLGTADLTVTKVVENSDAAFTDFTYFLTLDDADPAHQAFDEDGVTVFNLPIGTTFTVVEQDHGTSWEATYSGCTGVVSVQGASCTITNTFEDDTVRITDPVIPTLACVESVGEGMLSAHFGYDNQNEGSVFLEAGEIENRMNGGGLLDQDQGQPSTFAVGANPDSFEVVFDGAIPLIWTLISDDTRSIQADANSERCGDTEPNPTTITLEKILIQDNGAVDELSNFEFFIDGSEVQLGVATEVTPGVAHVITEGYDVAPTEGEEVSDRYVATFSPECLEGSATLEAGEDVVCTIVNDDIVGEMFDGSLTFNVIVNGGDATPAGFNLYLDGDNVTAHHDDDSLIMPPGDYTLFQEPRTGYEAVFSGDCSGTGIDNAAGNIASDEDAVCTVTNTFVGGPGGNGGNSGGGSNGGGGNGGSNDDDSTPPGEVLGDNDEQDEPEDEVNVDEEVVIVPPPIVAGDSDELPRTGVPIAGVLALGSMLTFLARRKEQK